MNRSSPRGTREVTRASPLIARAQVAISHLSADRPHGVGEGKCREARSSSSVSEDGEGWLSYGRLYGSLAHAHDEARRLARNFNLSVREIIR